MSKKVLVVDDKAVIRTLLERILDTLRSQDVELLMAADGRTGLELALNERPDLIFLDVKLPYLSGYEVCQRIKAVASEIHVIMLTGQELNEEHNAEIGADEYIAKPFRPDYILERVTNVLGLHS